MGTEFSTIPCNKKKKIADNSRTLTSFVVESMLLLMQPQRVQFFAFISLFAETSFHMKEDTEGKKETEEEEKEKTATGGEEVYMPQMRPLMWAQGGLFAVFLTHSSP